MVNRRPTCAQLDAVLWLTGGALFLAGIVVAVLACRDWRWH